MAWATVLSLLGLLTSISVLYKFLLFILVHFWPSPSTSLARYKHGSESWALVTGASDGIGYGYVQELIRRGFKVVLLSRNREKLQTCQSKLAAEFAEAETRIMVLDALTASPDDMESAMAGVKELNITILVNNIGGVPLTAQPYFKPLSTYTINEVDRFVDMNARFMARITALTLPLFIRTQKPCLVLNISSGSEAGIPWLVLYSAGKGFVNAFSRALRRECIAEKVPVDVLNITPAEVQSHSQNLSLSLMVPSSRAFAKDTLDKVGWAVRWGYWDLWPYIMHQMALTMLTCMPEWMQTEVLEREMRKKKAFYDTPAKEAKKID